MKVLKCIMFLLGFVFCFLAVYGFLFKGLDNFTAWEGALLFPGCIYSFYKLEAYLSKAEREKNGYENSK